MEEAEHDESVLILATLPRDEYTKFVDFLRVHDYVVRNSNSPREKKKSRPFALLYGQLSNCSD